MKRKNMHTVYKTLTLLAFTIVLTLCPSTLLASKNDTYVMVHTKGHIENPKRSQADAPLALNLAA